MSKDKTAHDTLWDLIKDIRFGMLAHRTSGGMLHAHPLTTQNKALDEQSELYFFIPKQGELYERLQTDGNVNVAYADPGADSYVSLSGQARFSDDQAKKEALWSPMAKAWFPDGPTDPNLALLVIKHAACGVLGRGRKQDGAAVQDGQGGRHRPPTYGTGRTQGSEPVLIGSFWPALAGRFQAAGGMAFCFCLKVARSAARNLPLGLGLCTRVQTQRLGLRGSAVSGQWPDLCSDPHHFPLQKSFFSYRALGLFFIWFFSIKGLDIIQSPSTWMA